MPIRLLRPGLRQSERFNKLPYFEQTFYVRLLTLVDDYGRYEAHPALLRSEAFPFGGPKGEVITVPSIDSALRSLDSQNLLMLYEVEGKKYLQLTRWKDRVRSESKFPGPVCGQVPASDGHLPVTCPPPSPSPSPSAIPPTPQGGCCASLEIPESLKTPDFEAMWATWVPFRRGLGKKPKDWSQMFSAQLAWLSSFGPAEATMIIAQSMRQGWQGLFERKQQPGQLSNGQLSNVERIDRGKELERVEARLKEIASNYESHQSISEWSQEHRQQHRTLRARAKTLVEMLGYSV